MAADSPHTATRSLSTLHKAGSFLRSSFENLFSGRGEALQKQEHIPLCVFYHATARLKKAVKELDSARTESDQSIAIDVLHSCQTDVLMALENVFADVNDPRHSRDYKLKFPTEVQQELTSNFWETLLFAAELIADGRVLEGRERATELLRPSAIELCDAFETVNRVLRAQARKDPSHYTTKVRSCLRYFDTVWTTFENLYVRAVVPCPSEAEYDERQEMTVLFSEGVLRGLRSKAITQDMIDSYEPQAMYAIPRLAMMTGLLLNAETLEGYHWLTNETYQVKEIKKRLASLTEEEVTELEVQLSNGVEGDEVGTTRVHELFRLISALTDNMQQGERRKEFIDIMSTLFKMYQDHPLLDSNYEEDATGLVVSDGQSQVTNAQEDQSQQSNLRPVARGRSRGISTGSHNEFMELSMALAEQSEEARHILEANIGPVANISHSAARRKSSESGQVESGSSNATAALLGLTASNLGLSNSDIQSEMSQVSLISYDTSGVDVQPLADATVTVQPTTSQYTDIAQPFAEQHVNVPSVEDCAGRNTSLRQPGPVIMAKPNVTHRHAKTEKVGHTQTDWEGQPQREMDSHAHTETHSHTLPPPSQARCTKRIQ